MNKNKSKFPLARQGSTGAILAALCIVCMLFFAVYGCKQNIESSVSDETELIDDGTILKDSDDRYVFPIQPGSEAWFALDMPGRYAACQIPENVLATISTAGLLETCLDIAFLREIVSGFDRFVSVMNGFQELLKRPDLPNVLMNKCSKFNEELNKVYSKSLVEQGRFTLKVYVVGLLTAQDIILDNLNEEQFDKLVFLTLEQFKTVISHADLFGNWNDTAFALFFAKIIVKKDLAPANVKEELMQYIQKPFWIERDIIFEYLDAYLNLKYKID